jgi:hypothetical protein
MEVSENEERQTSFIYDISDFVKKKRELEVLVFVTSYIFVSPSL